MTRVRRQITHYDKALFHSDEFLLSAYDVDAGLADAVDADAIGRIDGRLLSIYIILYSICIWT